MTNQEKYIALVQCRNDYRRRMPSDIHTIGVIKTDNPEYPEIIEIHWKSGGKAGIGNTTMVEVGKPLMGDFEAFKKAALEELDRQMDELMPLAEAEAYNSRPWTYILCVLDDNGNRVERYSRYDYNSWELCGETDSHLLDDLKDTCRRFRSESTSRWHVYRRMRGDTKLVEVF